MWSGGRVRDALLGVDKGGHKHFMASSYLGANRNGWDLKGVLFFVAVEARVFDVVGGAVRELESG